MERLQQEAAEAEAEAGPAAQPPASADVFMLLRLRDQMKQQLMECSTAVHTGQESCLDQVTEKKCISSATQNLKQDLENVKVSFQNKALALQRIQLTVALRNKIRQNYNDSRMVIETLKQIVTLSKEVLQHQQRARENEQKLNDIKRKRLSIKKAGRQKLLHIHMLKKQKEEKPSKVSKLMKIHSRLEKERVITTLIQNVFQNIIIASRVNWAEDPSLKSVVLQLEKNINAL